MSWTDYLFSFEEKNSRHFLRFEFDEVRQPPVLILMPSFDRKIYLCHDNWFFLLRIQDSAFDFWLIFDLNKYFSKFLWPAFRCFEYYWNQVREKCKNIVVSFYFLGDVEKSSNQVMPFCSFLSKLKLIHMPIRELYGSSYSMTNEIYQITIYFKGLTTFPCTAL